MQIKFAVLRSMDAAYPYADSKPLTVETLELQPPGPGEVLVKVAAAGLCHSDLSVINGSRPRPMPMAIGHEAAGTVIEVGEGVDDLQPGDHAAMVFMPTAATACPVQRAGRRYANRGQSPTATERCCPVESGSMIVAARSITTSAARPSPTMPWFPAVPS